MNSHLQHGSEKPLLWRHLVVENDTMTENSMASQFDAGFWKYKRVKQERTQTGLTFMFVVGELPVGHSEPALLKVFLTKTFSALSPFLYLPVRKQSQENEVQKPLKREILKQVSGLKRIKFDNTLNERSSSQQNTDPGPVNRHSPLLQNHCVLQPTGLLTDVRGDLIQELENEIKKVLITE